MLFAFYKHTEKVQQWLDESDGWHAKARAKSKGVFQRKRVQNPLPLSACDGLQGARMHLLGKHSLRIVNTQVRIRE